MTENTIIRNSAWTVLKEYFLITLGILLYVLGWSVFLVPNNLIGGGVTGMASIVQYATGGAIKIGVTYFVVNVILVGIAIFTLGKGFGGKSVYAMVIASIGLTVFQSLIPEDIIHDLVLANGPLMSTIMGGIMVGVGIGMSMSQGGSTGGTDIIALIVNKYRGVSPGRMLLMMDVAIILSSLAVPSFETVIVDGVKTVQEVTFTAKIAKVFYGFILVAICSTVLDYYLAGSKQSVQLFILSKKYAEIADVITKDLHRGVTVLNGKGWYTKQDTEVLMVLTRRSDVNLLLKYVKAIDSNAFLSVSSVTGVYGKGFEAIKSGLKR